MGAAETGFYRLESGAVLEMDHPLQDGVAHRVKTGEIMRVMAVATDDGTVTRWEPYSEPDNPEAESAEAEAHSKALDRIDALQGELNAVNEMLVAAGVEEPLGAAGVVNLAAMADGRLEELNTANARIAELEAELAEVKKAAEKKPAKKSE